MRPDSGELPGTLVSGLGKRGLSASEDTDHIGETRNMEVYRLGRGDGGGGNREALRISGLVVMLIQSMWV